ncbi:ribonuclease [Rhizobium sp. ARZ01]|nr:ribonuclease [Rhizobium sp. ARZ01]
MTAMLLFLLTLAVPVSAVTLADEPEDGDGGKAKTRHVLALTWQPGFCLRKPKMPECAQWPEGAHEPTGLALHGLWQVKKSYCGIDAELKKRDRSNKWTDLPQLVLSEETATRLSVAMPGVASGLDRHQWLMNGTCHAATAEDYYVRSLEMLDAVNASAVGALFDAKAGKVVTKDEIAAAFDAAFGPGAGERVRLRCRNIDGEKIITGLTIGLSADEGELAGLIRGASATKSKCDGGLLVQMAD